MMSELDIKKIQNLLKGRVIFLSASFPRKDREKEQKFFRKYSPDDITDAVNALVRAVLSAGGKLIFGGHPTITPLVLSIAKEYLPDSLEERTNIEETDGLPVIICQSEFYKDKLTDATKELYQNKYGKPIWTPEVESSSEEKLRAMIRELKTEITIEDEKEIVKKMIEHAEENKPAKAESLLRMRITILQKDPFAAVFIGGMQGVNAEYELFSLKYPSRPKYCIGAPGGYAKELAKNNRKKYSKESGLRYEELESFDSYPLLMQKIILDISEELKHI
ncbi:MAG: hypothetical protein QNJ55_13395 [Xenococcus sp. MO_188.B8]|nr:hypothetical protein [Xenococcus sp. MO_188.B8]